MIARQGADEFGGEGADGRPTLRRRGLIAGAATLAVGILAKRAAQPVAAVDGYVYLGTINTAVHQTGINATSGFELGADGVFTVNAGAVSADRHLPGITAVGGGSGAGVYGYGGITNGPGILGEGGGTGAGVEGHGFVGVVGRSAFDTAGFAAGLHGTGVAGYGDPFAANGYGVVGFGGRNPAVTPNRYSAGIVGTTYGYLPTEPITAGTMGLSNVDGIPGVYGHATVGNTPGIYGSGANASAGVFGINSNRVGIGVQGYNDHGAAVQGNTSEGAGVIGVATTGIGVEGFSTSGAGVYGDSNTTHGVLGITYVGSAGGVYGYSDNGFGVIGSSANAGAAGVYGVGNGAGIPGVYGSASGPGVVGKSTAATYHGIIGMGGAGAAGVYGTSVTYGLWGAGSGTSSIGVYGTAIGIGIFGYSTGSNPSILAYKNEAGVALTAVNGNSAANAYAGHFQGNTVVQGNFTVVGGAKSAAVPHPDGSHRLVYCVESPESWFEDFGKTKLVGGKAEVTLDPAFAAVTHLDDYHVFLTPYGETNGLHVTNQGAAGFTVQEHKGGTSSLTFSWRAVARRKDIKGERLAKFDPPKIDHPEPPQAPKPSDLPKIAEPPHLAPPKVAAPAKP